jgi:uncharacterized protein HemX
MPEDKDESKGAEKPPFDPMKLLGQLERIVKDNKKPSGGGKSWVGTLVIIAVVLVGVAVWSWISWRRNRELAKLRHEKNKTKILADQAVVDDKVAEGDAAIAEAERTLDKAREDLRRIEADIRAEEARYEADLRAIDSIRSWRDVDPGAR